MGRESCTGWEDAFTTAPLQHPPHRRLVEREGVVVDIQLDVARRHVGIHFLRVRGDIVAAGVGMRERVFDAGAKRAIDRGAPVARPGRAESRSPRAAAGSASAPPRRCQDRPAASGPSPRT